MGYFYGKDGPASKDVLQQLGISPQPMAQPGGGVGAQAAPGGGVEGGVGGDAGCKQGCWDRYREAILTGGDITEAERARTQCLQDCEQSGMDEEIKDPTFPGGEDDGANTDYPGCAKGRKYPANAQGDCITGYVFVQKNNVAGYQGQCECQKWCQDIGYDTDCVTFLGTGASKLGEYQYPQELQDLMGGLYARGREALARKPGYGDSVINALFGQGNDKMRQAAEATRMTTEANLADEGLLGTGVGQAALNQVALDSSAKTADLKRDVLIANEAQKRQDLQTFTDIAQKMAATGMTFEQIREAINAGRRGEGQASLALMLQYMLGLANSWKS